MSDRAVSEVGEQRSNSVAIIGMACRFPGAPSIRDFWKLLRDARDGVSDYPAGRTRAMDAFYLATGTPSGPKTRRSGSVAHVKEFDAEFFGISPREAVFIDPQQRLLLELTWEALEDAGCSREQVAGSRTGVYVGVWASDYQALLNEDRGAELLTQTGAGLFSASGRIAYTFDLEGPEASLNLSCASGLAAVHYACQTLRAGGCEIALAGAANVILQPDVTAAFSRGGVLADDGKCKFGDANADGFVRSEGAAMLVLKRLADALRDGDRVHAVLRGSAVGNNGSSSGSLTKPAPEAQANVIRQAHSDAGVAAEQVQYVEAHGTGTEVGDPIELAALSMTVGQRRGMSPPCIVGSAKTNIGHTEAVSGVSGLIKTVLAMQHRFIPKSLHVERLNSKVDWAASGLRLAVEGEDWPSSAIPRLAGVSSFGLAGTNVHILVEEAPFQHAVAESRASFILPLSAHSDVALGELANSWLQRLQDAEAGELADICFTAARRSNLLSHRLAVTGSDVSEITDGLREWELREKGAGTSRSSGNESVGPVIFVFPGQGGQWFGMGRQLFESEPVFRLAIEACSDAIQAEAGWSLLEQLTCGSGEADLVQISRVQPTLFAIMVALARLWMSWGVMPDFVVGHSMGEVAAAHIAGALTLEDAVAVICRRSRLLEEISGRGAMAMVELPMNEAARAIAGRSSELSVAASNGRTATVVSGEPAALQEVVERLIQDQVFCRLLKVDVASHSPQVDPLLEDLRTALEGIQPQSGAGMMYSTVDARMVDGSKLGADYWVRNLRQPVLFHAAIEELLAKNAAVFVEVSPHPTLTPYVQQAIAERGSDALVVNSLRRENQEQSEMCRGLAALYSRGVNVSWRSVYRKGNVVPLPPFPWQRKHYWVEQTTRRPAATGQRTHPLLGDPEATAKGEWIWRGEISLAAMPWLKDHVVNTSILLPASTYLEMATVAMRRARPAFEGSIESLTLIEAVSLAEDRPTEVQVILSPEIGDRWGIDFFFRASEDAAWVRAGTAKSGSPMIKPDSAAPATAFRSDDAVATEHYAVMSQRGYGFGPAFRSITGFELRDRTAVAAACLQTAVNVECFNLHPILLDAGLQLLATLFLKSHAAVRQLVPVRIERFASWLPAKKPVGIVMRASLPDVEIPAGNVSFFGEDGELVAIAEGVSFHQAAFDEAHACAEMMYEVRWIELPALQEPGVAEMDQGRPSEWLVVGSGSGLARAFSEALRRRGLRVSSFGTVEEAASALGAAGEALFGVVDLRALEEDTLRDRDMIPVERSAEIASLVQAMVGVQAESRLWIVTNGAVAIEVDRRISFEDAAAWGLGACIANEHPELQTRCIDLSSVKSAGEAEKLAQEVLGATNEDRVALRGGRRYGARLGLKRLAATPVNMRPASDGENFYLRQGSPGVLDDFFLERSVRRAPAEDELELEIRASGLNFRNVMEAMNLTQDATGAKGVFGMEAAGVVTRVGQAVNGLKVGDEVMALTGEAAKAGFFARYLTVPAKLVVLKPNSLNYAQAASLPAVFLTAEYALRTVANLRRSERVLIHAGTGGVGMAAIQVARRIGAEVLATAGTEEKRSFLRGLGIEHVFDSRSTGFAARVLAATNGLGVDVVLNSLSGEAIAAGMQCLAPYGRFVEIGKRDMWQDSKLGMSHFLGNRSFLGFDLAQMMGDRADTVASLMQELYEAIKTGEAKPIPVQVFPVSRASEAFQLLAKAGHIGKIIIDFSDAGAMVHSERPVVSADATYLITGGTGALGFEAAKEVVSLGARHLMLTTRSEPPADVNEQIEQMRHAGVDVRLRRLDLGVEAEVKAMLDDMKTTMPALRGVIHSAGVLDDALVTSLKYKHFEAVMAGKTRGAIYLDRHTADCTLDFFVLYSSVACVLGSPGQGNYAAANAVLDALAVDRVGRGLAATSVNWGPWSEVGLAAAKANRGERIASKGLPSLSPREGRMLLRQILRQPPTPDVIAAKVDVEGWCRALPAAESSPLLSRLPREGGVAPVDKGAGLVGRLRLMIAKAASETLQAHVLRLVAEVIHASPERIPLQKPLRTVGLDSLMGLEVRNKLEISLKLRLPASVIWNYPTVESLTAHLYQLLNLEPKESTPDSDPIESSAAFDSLAREIEEAEELLAEDLV